MKEQKKSLLINYSGSNKYTEYNSIENLIKYITRTNKKPSGDLIDWGGLGVTEFLGTDTVIKQFHQVQELHTRKGKFGRRIDHEIFSFSADDEKKISGNGINPDKIARRMAYDIYEHDRCQVVYGIHRPLGNNKHMHIHFAVNTVNFVNGNKRHENMPATREREKRFQNILENEITVSCKNKFLLET